MPAGTLEERVQELENTVHKVKEKLAQQSSPKKRRWRRFVGLYAESPDFDEVVRIGQEFRGLVRLTAHIAPLFPAFFRVFRVYPSLHFSEITLFGG